MKRVTRRVLSLIGIGLLGGFLSGTFGIGGGILMVPLFVLVLGIDQRHASALSLTAVLPAAAWDPSPADGGAPSPDGRPG